MRGILVVSVVALLTCAGPASGQGRDFSGRWSQNRAKTDAARGPIQAASLPGDGLGFYAGMAVTQEASKLTVQRLAPDGAVLRTETFEITTWSGDKLETTTTYPIFKTGAPTVQVTEKVVWYREGVDLVLEYVTADGKPYKIYYQRAK